MILYAEDTVIFTSGKNIAVVDERLNHDLTTLGNFFHNNNLVVNYDKNLNLQSHVYNIHKKVASRVKLLGKVRIGITPADTETIYRVMLWES